MSETDLPACLNCALVFVVCVGQTEHALEHSIAADICAKRLPDPNV